MSNLASVSIRRPVLTSVFSIVIVIFGLISFGTLGVREYPVVEPPVVTVVTTYPGANAEVVEREITEPIEDQLNAVSGIRTLTSTSSEGRSEIRAEFFLGIDLEQAANDSRDRVSRAAENLPNDANPPSVRKEDPNSAPIVFFNVTSAVRDRLELTTLVRNTFREQLRTIEGVSIVSIWGQQRPTLRLWMDPARLTAYDLSPADVRRAVDIDHVELPSGVLHGEEVELTIRTLGRLAAADEFENLILAENDGRIVRFSDVGQTELATRDDRTALRRNGQPMIGVVVIPQPGANQIDVAEEVNARVEQIQAGLPDDVEVLPGFDTSVFIQASIVDVQKTLFLAFLLVAAIIFLFLRDARTTLVPVVVVPVALIGSFFVMATAGFTINVLTMLALILAISLVVDDAIIVLENIFARLEEGLTPMEAGVQGTREVFTVIIATCLSLIAVFTPIIFMQGMTGQLFREFGVVMIGAVVISAFVGLTLAPMLTTRMLTGGRPKSRLYDVTEPYFVRLNALYRDSLDRFLLNRKLAVWALGGSALLIGLFFQIIPEEVAPLEDRSLVNVRAIAPDGATFQYMDGVMTEIIDVINRDAPEVEVLNTITSQQAANTGTGFLTLSSPGERDRGQADIARDLALAVRDIPGADVSVSQPQTLSVGGEGLPVQFVVQSADPEALREISQSFLAAIRNHPAFSQTEVDLRFSRPELRVEIDRNRARSLGVSVRDIGEVLQLSYSGARFGYFTQGGREEWVQGLVANHDRQSPGDLLGLSVRNSNGDLVRLDNLVTVSEGSGPPEIYRFNRLPSATFSADLAPGYSLGDGVEAMQTLAGEQLDESVFTDFVGASRDFVESAASLNFMFLLAIIFIYLVLAGQFESFRDPLIILLTVPLALAGSLLTLWYFGSTLNVFSKIAMIMLVGLVTKNGVLIVEFANQRQRRGLDRLEAAREAAVARFRPILMTSSSTILGVLPLAIAFGTGAESRSSMGIAVIGGLTFGTLLSLFVVPAMYVMIGGRSDAQRIEPETVSDPQL